MSPFLSRTEIRRLKRVANAKPSLRGPVQQILSGLQQSDRAVSSARSPRDKRAGWSVNIATTPVEQAREYARETLNEAGMSMDEAFTDFDANYQLAQQKLNKALDLPRHEMPVIEPEQIDEFMEDLQEGHVDIFQPWARGHLVTPEGFGSKDEAEEWVTLGLKDEKETDDVVRAKLTTATVAELKPTQSQVWFDKIIKNVVEFGVVDSGSPVLDMTTIISKDGYILDGHHRIFGAILGDPSLKQSVVHIPMEINLLVEIARSYGFALGNEPKH